VIFKPKITGGRLERVIASARAQGGFFEPAKFAVWAKRGFDSFASVQL
jgi:hypothetical protein